MLAVAFVAASATTSRAAPVAIEVYVGEPSAGTAERAAPALDELAKRGYSVGVEGVGAVLEAEVSRPGRTEGVSIKDVLAKLAEADDKWVATDYDAAAKMISEVLVLVRRNPALVVGDESLRKRILQAELVLARALMRTGNQTRAREVMADLITSFPDATITRADHGKEAATLYDEVKAKLERAGRTELRIVVDDPDVDVFINEWRIASGTVTVERLMGEYRIYTQRGTTPGRLHTVELRPGQPTEVEIEWMFEAHLFTSGAGVGLRYATEEEKAERVASDAVKIAGYMEASQVTVFGEGEIDAAPAFVGTTYVVKTASALRNGGVALSPEPSADDLRSLAAYLAGDPPAPSVLLLEPIPAEYRRQPEGSGSRHGWVKWTTGGTALALAGLGAWFFAIDGKGTCGLPNVTCPEYYETTAAGWSAGVGAAALTALTIWLFVDDPWKSSPPVEIGVTSTDSSTMVVLGGRF